jgi:DNA-binding NarL/FixJ family response regulator
MRRGHEGDVMSGVRDAENATSEMGALVGRARECATIGELVNAAGRGQSGVLVLAGPPGIGKSSLVRHAAESAPGFRVLRVTGVGSEMAFDYAGVHQLVRPILELSGELPEPQRLALDAALGRTPRDALDPFLVGLAVLSLVAEAARAEPVLIVVDDAQWLDDESVTVLSFVGRRLLAERVAMLVTISDTTGPPAGFETFSRLDLVGLPAEQARELFTQAAASPVDMSVGDVVVAAAQGNPLALVELATALSVQQVGGLDPLPDPLPIGDHLSGFFDARIEALDADARMLLLLAAAERLGDPVLLRRAADAAGALAWNSAVGDVEASGLMRFGPTVDFRHPLVRSAVYYAASGADRRRAHSLIADALDAEADADRRAWHLGAAAAGPDEEVAHALEVSAERARQRGGSSAAASYLRLAAELTPARERRTERLLEAARAELIAGRGPQARDMLSRAEENGLTARHAADAAWTQALIHIVAGDVREPVAPLASALEGVESDDTELAVGTCVAADLVTLAGAYLIDETDRHTIAAAAAAVVDRCGVPAPIAPLVVGISARTTGGRAAATAMLQAAVAGAVEDQARLQSVAGRHVHVVCFNAVIAAADVLDDAAWDGLVHSWAQLARSTGALAALPVALSFRSWLEVLQGRPGSAASHLDEIEDVVSVSGSRGLLGAPPPAQVLRHAWQGDEDATRTGARRMMQDAHERGAGMGVDQAYAALTVLELGAGRYDAALRAATRVCEHDSFGVAPLALGDLVEAATRCGESGLAADAVERLAELAAASGTAWASGVHRRARALVETGDDADELFLSALDDLSRTTIATETARTQLLHGEWLRRAQRRKEARDPLHEALDFFDRIGAKGFAARAGAELAASGEHVRSRSAPMDLLTPQEARIARLAASGERNRDIAAQLFITTSTVEYHLRKIFVKLGVQSRTQLAQVDLPT